MVERGRKGLELRGRGGRGRSGSLMMRTGSGRGGEREKGGGGEEGVGTGGGGGAGEEWQSDDEDGEWEDLGTNRESEDNEDGQDDLLKGVITKVLPPSKKNLSCFSVFVVVVFWVFGMGVDGRNLLWSF